MELVQHSHVSANGIRAFLFQYFNFQIIFQNIGHRQIINIKVSRAYVQCLSDKVSLLISFYLEYEIPVELKYLSLSYIIPEQLLDNIVLIQNVVTFDVGDGHGVISDLYTPHS